MKRTATGSIRWFNLGMAISAGLLLMVCSGKGAGNEGGKMKTSAIKEITSFEEFTTLVDGSGDKLLAFDLYAVWCMPCKILAPTLEKLAREHAGKVAFYRVDVDKVPKVSAAFNVSGIPYVVFVKNKQTVGTLTGVQPEEAYLRMINGGVSVPVQKTSLMGGGFKNISGADAVKLIADAQPLILDVRSSGEFASGFIPGAKLIPVNELADRIGEIAEYKEKDVLVYCHSGNRSLSAARVLAENGFGKVNNLKGGVMVWKRERRPLVTPPPSGL